mmetsp:Transcript_3414/g.8808  ORF Transcript_3414/g.8808 Transcript_3414/m.8808 type:complete len:251 (-) Transcript_3414:1024-1776(-)
MRPKMALRSSKSAPAWRSVPLLKPHSWPTGSKFQTREPSPQCLAKASCTPGRPPVTNLACAPKMASSFAAMASTNARVSTLRNSLSPKMQTTQAARPPRALLTRSAAFVTPSSPWWGAPRGAGGGSALPLPPLPASALPPVPPPPSTELSRGGGGGIRPQAPTMSASVSSTEIGSPRAFLDSLSSKDCFEKVKMRSHKPPFIKERASGSVLSSIKEAKRSRPALPERLGSSMKPAPFAVSSRICARSVQS